MTSTWRCNTSAYCLSSGDLSGSGKCGPFLSTISTTMPMAWGITRISEKMMAASRSPAKRSTGWRVKVEATSGSRQHSKKSRLPLASWYSGRYRPAVHNIIGISQDGRDSSVGGIAAWDRGFCTLAHHPHGRPLDLLACESTTSVVARVRGKITHIRQQLAPCCPEDQVIL